jgi:hypothetical protein
VPCTSFPTSIPPFSFIRYRLPFQLIYCIAKNEKNFIVTLEHLAVVMRIVGRDMIVNEIALVEMLRLVDCALDVIGLAYACSHHRHRFLFLSLLLLLLLFLSKPTNLTSASSCSRTQPSRLIQIHARHPDTMANICSYLTAPHVAYTVLLQADSE